MKIMGLDDFPASHREDLSASSIQTDEQCSLVGLENIMVPRRARDRCLE